MADPQPASPHPQIGRAVFVALGLSAAAAVAYLLYEQGAPGRKDAAEVASMLTGTEGAKITFYVLDPKGGRAARPATEFFDTWTIVRKEPLSDSGEVRALRDALTSGSTYSSDNIRCFEPGMGFRFQKEARVLDLAVCLDCKKVVAHEAGNDRSWNLSGTGCNRFRSIYDAHVR